MRTPRATLLAGVCMVGILVASGSSLVFAQAPTPDKSQKWRVTTNVPKKDGKFSVTVNWTSDGGTKQHVTATIDVTEGEDPTEKATKLNEELNKQLVVWGNDAGVTSEQGTTAGTGTLLPEVIIMNRLGFQIVNVKPRDRSNEKDAVDTLMSFSFAEAKIRVFIGLHGVATEGTVALEMSDTPAVIIETAGKSLAEIEEEMSKELNALGVDVILRAAEPDLEDEDEFPPVERWLYFPSLDAQRIEFGSDDTGIDTTAVFEFEKPVHERPSLDLSLTAVLLVLGLAAVLIFVAFGP